MLASGGESLPHGWIAGDDEMGRSTRFRRELEALGERYLLAVPSNTSIRDLEAERPAYRGRGQPPKQPFQRVEQWRDSLPEEAWVEIDVRDGDKGPLIVEAAKTRVEARTQQGRGQSARKSCSSRVRSQKTARRNTTTTCPMRRGGPRWKSSRGWQKPSIGLRNAFSEERAKRDWPTTKCEPGWAGITIRPCRSSRRGS